MQQHKTEACDLAGKSTLSVAWVSNANGALRSGGVSAIEVPKSSFVVVTKACSIKYNTCLLSLSWSVFLNFPPTALDVLDSPLFFLFLPLSSFPH